MVGGWWVRWWTGRDGMRVGMVEDDWQVDVWI